MEFAQIINELTVKNTVIEVFQHPNGGIFALDSSFIEQVSEEWIDPDTNKAYPIVPDPFNFGKKILLD